MMAYQVNGKELFQDGVERQVQDKLKAPKSSIRFK